MSRQLLFVTLFMFAFSSCQKQALADGHPLIGKWRALQYTVEYKCESSPSAPSFDPGQPLKKAEVEIKGSGDIIVTFDGKKEKLRIREIKESASSARFNAIMIATKEYVCKVINKKGQTFYFHFYFDSTTNLMVGTYWTPHHPYYTVDVPNSAVVTCEWGSMDYGGYDSEFFVKYQKIE